MNRKLKIGELAKRVGCLVETIHYYEKQGLLLKPARSIGNFRLYDKTHIERLQFIRYCRSLDMTLDEIRILLGFKDNPEANCHEVNNLLSIHIKHVVDRIGELRLLEKNLKALRSLCQETQAAKYCGILQSLAAPPVTQKKSSNNHQKPSHLHKIHK